MNRHLIAFVVTLAAVTVLMPSAGASRNSDRPAWSTPENLGSTINSQFNEGNPVISGDGLALYFGSSRPDGVSADLYVARRESIHDPWGDPVKLGDTINTAGFEGFPALSANEHHLFFVRPTTNGAAEIWVSYRRNVQDDLGDSGWEPPTLLAPGVNTAVSEQGPSYFENRRRGLPQLYFHRADGIYVAEAFGLAVPVQELSSPEFEGRPSISRDGLEIFFHSNRHRPGVAEFDMYSSVRKSVLEPWSTPQNLGSDVNTEFNDYLGAISPDGETLYFTSNRPGGFGGNDIYVTTRSKRIRLAPAGR